jgi:hypothetical protein
MVGLAPPSLLGSGSRHCYGINFTSVRFSFAFFRDDECYGDFATTISEMGLHAARAGIDNLGGHEEFRVFCYLHEPTVG